MLVPLTDHIILEPVDAPEMTVGGIHLPDSARKTSRAKVVSMGPGGYDKRRQRPIPMPDVAIGDTVIYRSYAGSPLCQEVVVGGKPLLVVEPADVLAKVV